MSHLTFVLIFGAIALGLVLLRAKPLQRILILFGVGSTAIVVLLICEGRISIWDLSDTVVRYVSRVVGSTQNDSDAGTAARRQRVGFLDSIHVERPTPHASYESLSTFENSAAPIANRVTALQRLVEDGAKFRRDGNAVSGREILAEL